MAETSASNCVRGKTSCFSFMTRPRPDKASIRPKARSEERINSIRPSPRGPFDPAIQPFTVLSPALVQFLIALSTTEKARCLFLARSVITLPITRSSARDRRRYGEAERLGDFEVDDELQARGSCLAGRSAILFKATLAPILNLDARCYLARAVAVGPEMQKIRWSCWTPRSLAIFNSTVNGLSAASTPSSS
jgi:hypothetical protein